MDATLKYAWEQSVVNALLELRPECVPKKINVAQTTIFERLHNLQTDSDERAALRDALNILRVVFSSTENEDKRKPVHKNNAA
jgi:hypothetical protein